jgi:hypothetical protein
LNKLGERRSHRDDPNSETRRVLGAQNDSGWKGGTLANRVASDCRTFPKGAAGLASQVEAGR